MTSYPELDKFTGTDVVKYCYRQTEETQRRIVNMCIQGSNATQGIDFTYLYECGGQNYDLATPQEHTSANCTDNLPTPAPTAMTSAPSTSPTTDGQSYDAICTESTCAGVEGPRADGVAGKSVVVAFVFALFASLMA